MPIPSPEGGSASDIELPVLTSHARSVQPPLHGQASSLSLITGTSSENRKVNLTDEVNGIEPPIPAYFPPSHDIPPIPSFDAGLLAYTRTHGHSEIPLSPRQEEDDRTSVQASEAHPEALPAYKADNPPIYSHRPTPHDEPTTWSMICFKLGFLFPLFWLCGALTLITPRDSLSRLFMPWFRDFAPSANSWCDDSSRTEAEKEAYLERMRTVEIAWAKKCFFAFSLLLCFIIAVAVIIVAISKVH